MNKKIFIIYASAGVGHKKAASSLKNAFEEVNFKGEVKLIDSLDYTNSFFKYTYPKTYHLAIQYFQLIWGFFYFLLDNALFYKICVSWIRRIVNHINSKALREFILKEKPDIILSTHFFAPEVIGNMKKKGLIDTKIVSVITDFKMHTFWVSEGIDFYVVAHDYTKDDLLKRGIKEDRIGVFGIPIERAFSISYDLSELRKKLAIEDTFTVLIGSGGWGVGPIEKLVRSLESVEEHIQILVVCGQNKKLYEDISRITKELKNPLKVYGFVDNMAELMALSNCIVTKSGGLTTSEALASNLPMIVIRPIPGQESRNCKFLIKFNAGLRIDSIKDVKNKIIEFVKSKDALKILKDNIGKIRKPYASSDIIRFSLSLLEN